MLWLFKRKHFQYGFFDKIADDGNHEIDGQDHEGTSESAQTQDEDELSDYLILCQSLKDLQEFAKVERNGILSGALSTVIVEVQRTHIQHNLTQQTIMSFFDRL